MVHSVRLNTEIPVQVTSKNQFVNGLGNITRYTVKDNRIPVGYVDLQDTPHGCYVMYIKNQNPELYKGFGKVADQIEVEHCLKRNIEKPVITSEAKFNTHITHFKRGKRFINEGINIFLQNLIENLSKGEKYITSFLGTQKMFMPQNLVNKYMEIIKKAPLLR